MLKVNNINTFYGQFQALHNVSFKIKDGELAVFLGSNGHGKSTLLKTICGLLSPFSGQIEFNGHLINKLKIHNIVKLGIVYVPEEGHLFPELTVKENLLMGAYNRRARKDRYRNEQLVYSIFTRLEERKHQLASTLSGGERQMLAMGRGLMASATLMAIDEPSMGLAPILKKSVFKKIKQINDEEGLTIILVEQEVEASLDISDKAFVLREGKIVLSEDSSKICIETIQKHYLV